MLPGDALLRAGAFGGWRAGAYTGGLGGAAVGIIGWTPLAAALLPRLAAFGARLNHACPPYIQVLIQR
jgi:phosphoglycerate dehydrogenase-like enzyme